MNESPELLKLLAEVRYELQRVASSLKTIAVACWCFLGLVLAFVLLVVVQIGIAMFMHFQTLERVQAGS
jgi:hypothetical protein